MYGFQPKSARGKTVQQLADGGMVHSIKGMLGLRPKTREELLAADAKAQARNQEAAAKMAERAAQQPAPAASAPQNAITDYAGMSAMKRREKEQGLKNGGMVKPHGFKAGGLIRGPGTGTSDSIPDKMAPGTYILPADTTKKLALDDKKVPVRVSNGEYELPPEQVQAVGAAVLDAIKGVTHAPKSPSARGLQSPQDEQFFATGGSVRDPEELRKMIPQVEAMGYAQSPAAAPAPVAAPVANVQAGQPRSVSPSALYMQDRASEMREQVGSGNYAQAAGTAARTAVQGLGMYGVELADKAGTPLVNAARGFGRGVLGADANAAPSTPAAATAPAAPAPATNPPTTTSTAGAGRGVVNPSTVNPAAPAPSNAPAAAPEVMPGVYRHGRGQYSDNAAGMGMPANFTGQPSAQNLAAADNLARGFVPGGNASPAVGGGSASAPAGITAPVIRNSTNDWAARNNLRNMEVSAKSITANGGRFDQSGRGDSPEVAAYKAALANDFALQQAQPGLAAVAMRENAGIQREGMQQEGATTRTGMTEQGANAREAGRNALAQGELGLKREAAGFQTRAAQRRESAYDNYSKAKTDEDRQAIARQFPDLFGQAKDAAHRMEVVRGKTDPMTGQSSGDYVVVQDPRTGEVRQIQMGAAPAPQEMPKPASKAEFDALPKGTRFTDPNGQVRIK